MILVVCVHTSTFSEVDTYPYSELFGLFRMPLFFFICGFIFYKSSQRWNFINSIKFLSNKFLVQIIPTIIFLSLYLFVIPYDSINGKLNGYWFTVTLFEYFLVYTFCNLFIQNQILCNILLFFIAICLFITRYLSWTWEWYTINPFINEFIIFNFEFFVYFIIGLSAKKHFKWICKYLFNNNIIMLSIIASTFVFAILFLNGYFVKLETKLALSILCIFSIFYFFMKNGEYFDNSRFGKALQFIGRRTLDIYLLHYFFVHSSISWIKNIGIDSPTLIFVISILTALVIIGICLLISKFLRTNPLLGKILFGAKMPSKIENK
ncbi:MAG: acyltransferase family protein [Muribaculaceae bacterium]|nr:acyltransferase family protein [Muribaculaceae bacterium]